MKILRAPEPELTWSVARPQTRRASSAPAAALAAAAAASLAIPLVWLGAPSEEPVRFVYSSARAETAAGEPAAGLRSGGVAAGTGAPAEGFAPALSALAPPPAPSLSPESPASSPKPRKGALALDAAVAVAAAGVEAGDGRLGSFAGLSASANGR